MSKRTVKRKLRAKGLGDDPVVWLKGRVLDRIGVSYAGWKRGRDGNPFLPQGAQLTARNWAKFGQWVMDGGQGVDARAYEALIPNHKRKVVEHYLEAKTRAGRTARLEKISRSIKARL